MHYVMHFTSCYVISTTTVSEILMIMILLQPYDILSAMIEHSTNTGTPHMWHSPHICIYCTAQCVYALILIAQEPSLDVMSH